MHPWRTTVVAAVTSLALALVAMPPTSSAATRAAIPSDFDGDGYADLAVGVPGENRNAGVVNVLYGSVAGLTASGDQQWSQDSPGVKGTSQGSRGSGLPGDAFGASLASGDFDRDGFADLAIGVANDSAVFVDIDLSQRDIYPGGAVTVLYGSSAGLTAARDQRWSRTALSALGLGWDSVIDLASGDFDGDGYWDLSIGRQVYDLELTGDIDDGDLFWRTGVTTVYGGSAGLTLKDATGALSPPLNTNLTLAAGDLDADGLADLAVGDPAVFDHGAGAVDVYYGTPQGISTLDGQRWTQDSPGVEDDSEPGDAFGGSMAIGDYDDDGIGDLAIGVPGENERAGAVQVIFGSDAGLTAEGGQFWDQDSAGIPGTNEIDDDFGSALAAGDLDADGADDLAIGVRGDHPRAGSDPWGAVVTLYGGNGGLSASRSQSWNQDSPGVPGKMESYDWTQCVLAIANYGRSAHADLAIGAPGEDVGTREDAGMVNVLYGRSSGLSGINAQGWSQNTAGVRGTAETRDVFGSSLSQ